MGGRRGKNNKGGKGRGRGRSRGSRGRGPATATGRGGGPGPGPGRGPEACGRGPGEGRVAPQKPQMRLFQLNHHLILKCFDYLDDESRKNSFRTMGWPLDNYLRRQENMRKQMENMEKMRQSKLKKEEEENIKAGSSRGVKAMEGSMESVNPGDGSKEALITTEQGKFAAENEQLGSNASGVKVQRSTSAEAKICGSAKNTGNKASEGKAGSNHKKATDDGAKSPVNGVWGGKVEVNHWISKAKEREDTLTKGKDVKLDNKEGDSGSGEADSVSVDLRDLNKLALSVNVAWEDTSVDESTLDQEAQEETESRQDDVETDSYYKEAQANEEAQGEIDSEDDDVETGKESPGDNEASDVAKEILGEESAKEKIGGIAKEIKNNGGKNSIGKEASGLNETGHERAKRTQKEESAAQKEILPPLFARTDPVTLLAWLNTRRLYQRILYYKREERKKETSSEAKSGGIMEFIKEDLKAKKTRERVYKKNMTISEMADLEWNELLEVAELRNGGDPPPYYPIPTQHELLLFSPCPRAVGVLASYPRSGNSLMRTLYEHTTLRVTGSDMQGGLAKHDLVGEMAVGSNMVQFVKTHYPERQGTPAFRASRVVLLVRNPFDAMESFFNLMMTGTHTTSVTPEIRRKTVRVWEQYVLKEIRVWKGFHMFWMNQDVPILLVRYEDLIRQPDKVVGRVLQFVLDVKRMDTFFGERIDRCVREQAEIERLGSYKPRSGGIGKSLSKFSPELFDKLRSDVELRSIMGHLGYSDFFETPPEEWHSLKPLEDFATEYLPSWHGTANTKIVILNRGNLARGPNEVTPWQKIKMELGIVDGNCDCEKCRASRKRGDSINQSVGDNNPNQSDGGGQCVKAGVVIPNQDQE